ncbi:MAG: MFS transporter [Candidatus Tectomicrobia bacterium]|uniref:MFS transporter n=1 Tax=Tectimicrobiota bacterium TaxID=2528274 RepID=A0A932I5T5_UNCTE|nr:MFS transporter [Candidatus Tectomicrobia bacterium]
MRETSPPAPASPAAPAGRREIFAWCLYDFANSAFPTLIVTVAYSVYFKHAVAGGGGRGDFLWGVSLSLAMVLAILITPPLSARADRKGSRKRMLLLYAGACVAATALLSGVGPGRVAAGMIFFILAVVGFEGSLVFYNAFLPEISTRATIGKVSGWGWGLGYLGGLLCLFLVKPLLSGGLEPANLPRFRLSFAATAVFYALFTIPLVLWLRERPPLPRRPGAGGKKPAGAPASARDAFRELWGTLQALRRREGALRYLLAFLLYNDGIVTVISFSSIYAVTTLGFTMGETLNLFIAVQLSAGAGAFFFGYLTDAWGARKTVLLTLFNWCLVVILAYFAASKDAFFLISLLAGISLGSSQSASRSLLAFYIPPGGTAQTYSFYGVCGKMSSILGPLAFGGVSAATGSQRLAILSVLFFFLAGGALLWTVPEPGEAGGEAIAGD